MISVQREGATMACTEDEDQRFEGLCNWILTHSLRAEVEVVEGVAVSMMKGS